MEKSYNHLNPEERATMMLMMREGAAVRAVARILGRAPSTISRELKRNCPDGKCFEPKWKHGPSLAGRVSLLKRIHQTFGVDIRNLLSVFGRVMLGRPQGFINRVS